MFERWMIFMPEKKGFSLPLKLVLHVYLCHVSLSNTLWGRIRTYPSPKFNVVTRLVNLVVGHSIIARGSFLKKDHYGISLTKMIGGPWNATNDSWNQPINMSSVDKIMLLVDFYSYNFFPSNATHFSQIPKRIQKDC
jgi:hypothetical protein